MVKWIKNKLKKGWNFLKRQWRKIALVIGGVTLIALAAGSPSLTNITPIDFNGRAIQFEYGKQDIKTSQMTYGGWDKIETTFAVLNTVEAQDFDIRLLFEGKEKLVFIKEYKKDVPYSVWISDYGFAEYPCPTKWIATTTETPEMSSENLYQCDNETKYCDRIDKEGNCEVDNAYLGKHQETRYRDEWWDLSLSNEKTATSTFQSKKKTQYHIGENEVRYFKAKFEVAPKTEGEFVIQAIGDKGHRIELDPWYDSNWDYKRKITIEAGDSTGKYVGGVATTTDAPFVVVASTTQTWLKDTGSGGKIAQENGYDVIFVDDDDTTLLDFEIEYHSTSTGALVAWLEVPDVSSTTDRTIYMYYGNAAATNNATSGATWSPLAKGKPHQVAGAWHLPETPPSTNVLDSTNNDNNASTTGGMDSSDQVKGQLDGSLDFDGSDDYVDMGDKSSLEAMSALTISAWVYPSTDGNNGYILWKFDCYALGTNSKKFYFVVHGKDDAWSNSNIIGGQWYHVVARYDGSEVAIWLNGVKQMTYIGSGNGNVASSVYDFVIGARSYYHDNNWNGIIDDVRIYNIALTEADIKTMYNMGNDNASFLTWGSEETETVTDAPDTMDFGVKSGEVQIKSGEIQIK